jgi:hypothetical protein
VDGILPARGGKGRGHPFGSDRMLRERADGAGSKDQPQLEHRTHGCAARHNDITPDSRLRLSRRYDRFVRVLYPGGILQGDTGQCRSEHSDAAVAVCPRSPTEAEQRMQARGSG